MEHVWSAFISLRSATPSNTPISYGEIRHFLDLSGFVLDPWEIDAIKMLDVILLRANNDHTS